MHCGIKKASTLVKRSMFLSQSSTNISGDCALASRQKCVRKKADFRLKSAMFLRTPFCQEHDLQIYKRVLMGLTDY